MGADGLINHIPTTLSIFDYQGEHAQLPLPASYLRWCKGAIDKPVHFYPRLSISCL